MPSVLDPGYLAGQGMAYDPSTAQVMIFGGARENEGPVDSTRTFGNLRLAAAFPAGKPFGQLPVSMAADARYCFLAATISPPSVRRSATQVRPGCGPSRTGGSCHCSLACLPGPGPCWSHSATPASCRTAGRARLQQAHRYLVLRPRDGILRAKEQPESRRAGEIAPGRQRPAGIRHGARPAYSVDALADQPG
jgi:hypothetical protein